MFDCRKFWSLLPLFCWACGVSPAQDPTQHSTVKAQVSAAQAEAAFAIVYKLDYLPFNYIEDGCYARDLYMSMELASAKIPSSAHYIYGNLFPEPETAWAYHVAPLLKVGSEEPWILDPSFEKQPLRLSAWIKKNKPYGRYKTEIMAGSAYFDEDGRTAVFNDKRMVQNFEEMPTFLTSDIASACSVMYSYIARERGDISYKRSKLLNRTAELIYDLEQLGKLEDSGIGRGVQKNCKDAVRAAFN